MECLVGGGRSHVPPDGGAMLTLLRLPYYRSRHARIPAVHLVGSLCSRLRCAQFPRLFSRRRLRVVSFMRTCSRNSDSAEELSSAECFTIFDIPNVFGERIPNLAPITFSIVGYEFERGLTAFRESYRSSLFALERKSDDLKTALLDYQTALANGGEWIGEHDDDGFVVWDKEQTLKMDSEVVVNGAVELRKAYVVAVYHHWERSARKLTDYIGRDSAILETKAVEKGLAIGPDFQRVKTLANTLKHNSEARGLKLFEIWPEVFRLKFHPRDKTDWYTAITLSDRHMEAVFDAVTASGPKAMEHSTARLEALMAKFEV